MIAPLSPLFIHLSVCVRVHPVASDSLRPYGPQPTRLLCPWDFPGKNTGVGCHAFLQGIFLTQGWNLQLLQFLRWQVDSLPLNCLGIHTSEFTFYDFSRREPSLCQVCAGGWGCAGLSDTTPAPRSC